MAKVAASTHQPPAPFSKWRHIESGDVYEVLDNDCPTKVDVGQPWRHGVLYARADRADRAGNARNYHRTLEAFFAEMEPVK